MTANIKLTVLQRALLEDLCQSGAHCIEVGSDAYHSLVVARSLERRGMVNIETDEYGYRYASWDDEFHSEWTRMKEAEFQRAQEASS